MIFGKRKYKSLDGKHRVVIGDKLIEVIVNGDKIAFDGKEVTRAQGRIIMRNLIVAMEHIERSL